MGHWNLLEKKNKLVIKLFNEDDRSGHGKEQKKVEFGSTACQFGQWEEKKEKRSNLMVKET